jgi:hypothetical protein
MRRICIRHSSSTGQFLTLSQERAALAQSLRVIDGAIKGPLHKRPQAELHSVTIFAWLASKALHKPLRCDEIRTHDNAHSRI